MRVQRRTVTATAVLAAAGLAVTTVAAGPANADKPDGAATMAQDVRVEAVHAHLKKFQAIADANGGNRGAGTKGYDDSGAYVEKVLQKAGYTTKRQPFEFVYDEVVSTSLDEVSPDQRAIEHNPMSYSPSTPAGGVEAGLAAPSGAATGCTTADFTGFPAGQIALISRGTCAFAVKAQMAKAAGAPAAIVYNNTDGALNGTLGGPADNYAPITGVTKAEGALLLGKMANGPVTVKFDLVKIVEDRTTFNVIAETKTGRDDNVVMMGAHLDSVHDGPGINDNGSGSAGILETAVQLAKHKNLNNKVRFAWWGAEELGLLGSEHYVNELLRPENEGELDRIATYLNFDMIGSPNYQIGVYDADQSTYEAPVEVPAGSIETEKVLTDWFDKVGQPWVDTEFSGRSDYQAFILNGVPASGLFTGAEQPKTPEEAALFGGTAGVAYDPNYHSPEDDIKNISLEALDINSDAIAAAAITLAQDTSSINGERSTGTSGTSKPKAKHTHDAAA